MKPEHLPEALGSAEVFLEFQDRLSRVARVDRPVLILGERGTGKELAASRLHYLSQRWEGELVTLNCAALAPTLVESELFGYEPGAFTGAQRRRSGRFEAASGGTLFLDEIAQIPMLVQEKILRVVEYGGFERVGGTETISTDARIIAATNVNLSHLATEGLFKADLLDRLSFEVLVLPPLRARQEDILLLARHFAARMALELELVSVPEFSEAAMSLLLAYPWPGNIRELKNVVERAVYSAGKEVIDEIRFNPFDVPFMPDASLQANSARLEGVAPSTEQQRASDEDLDLRLSRSIIDSGDWKTRFSALEKKVLEVALERSEHHQGKAAKALGLSYDQFRNLFRKHRSRA